MPRSPHSTAALAKRQPRLLSGVDAQSPSPAAVSCRSAFVAAFLRSQRRLVAVLRLEVIAALGDGAAAAHRSGGRKRARADGEVAPLRTPPQSPQSSDVSGSDSEGCSQRSSLSASSSADFAGAVGSDTELFTGGLSGDDGAAPSASPPSLPSTSPSPSPSPSPSSMAAEGPRVVRVRRSVVDVSVASLVRALSAHGALFLLCQAHLHSQLRGEGVGSAPAPGEDGRGSCGPATPGSPGWKGSGATEDGRRERVRAARRRCCAALESALLLRRGDSDGDGDGDGDSDEDDGDPELLLQRWLTQNAVDPVVVEAGGAKSAVVASAALQPPPFSPSSASPTTTAPTTASPRLGDRVNAVVAALLPMLLRVVVAEACTALAVMFGRRGPYAYDAAASPTAATPESAVPLWMPPSEGNIRHVSAQRPPWAHVPAAFASAVRFNDIAAHIKFRRVAGLWQPEEAPGAGPASLLGRRGCRRRPTRVFGPPALFTDARKSQCPRLPVREERDWEVAVAVEEQRGRCAVRFFAFRETGPAREVDDVAAAEAERAAAVAYGIASAAVRPSWLRESVSFVSAEVCGLAAAAAGDSGSGEWEDAVASWARTVSSATAHAEAARRVFMVPEAQPPPQYGGVPATPYPNPYLDGFSASPPGDAAGRGDVSARAESEPSPSSSSSSSCCWLRVEGPLQAPGPVVEGVVPPEVVARALGRPSAAPDADTAGALRDLSWALSCVDRVFTGRVEADSVGQRYGRNRVTMAAESTIFIEAEGQPPADAATRTAAEASGKSGAVLTGRAAANNGGGTTGEKQRSASPAAVRHPRRRSRRWVGLEVACTGEEGILGPLPGTVPARTLTPPLPAITSSSDSGSSSSDSDTEGDARGRAGGPLSCPSTAAAGGAAPWTAVARYMHETGMLYSSDGSVFALDVESQERW